MAAAFKSALPAHLNPKSALGGNGDSNVEFARKHHGKTQSHMVSAAQKLLQMMECMVGLGKRVKDNWQNLGFKRSLRSSWAG
jgi:UTP--glucose-1-phosphate uridylyltransferase